MKAQLVGWVIMIVVAIIAFNFYKLGQNGRPGYPSKNEVYDCDRIRLDNNYVSPKWAQDQCKLDPYRKFVP